MWKILLILMSAIPGIAYADFPSPACLGNNVSFWESIYLQYGENDGIVHNTETFKIYANVILPPRTEKKARRAVVDSILKSVRSQNKEIPENQIRLQNGIKEKFSEGLARSYKYLPMIVPKIKEAGLPYELSLLPHVESSFDSTAVSKVGATGLWQIMLRTAKMFGFKHKEYLRDPVKSTEAAIAILTHKYQKAARNWPIAITAYNHGIGGMVRAMKETGSEDLCVIIQNYKGRSFGFASKNFYAQFLAVQKIVSPIYKESKVIGWE